MGHYCLSVELHSDVTDLRQSRRPGWQKEGSSVCRDVLSLGVDPVRSLVEPVESRRFSCPARDWRRGNHCDRRRQHFGLHSPATTREVQGLVGAAFGLATLVGPFLGGFLVQEVGWRWIFYVNIPFGIYCLAIIAWIFPNHSHENVPLDLVGALSLLAGLTSLVLLVELGVDGIISGILLVVLIASLIGVLRHSQRHSEPILSLRFFRHRTFSISVAVSFFVGVALLGSVSFLPTYYQDVRGFTPTQSGLEMLYLLAGMLITSIVIGRLISHLGSFRWFPIMGTACMALALALLSRIGQSTSFWYIDGALVLLGVGLGSTLQVMILSAQWSLPHRHLGVATSTVSLFRSLGGTLGVAAFGAVFTHFLQVAGGNPLQRQAAIVQSLHWDFGLSAALTLIAVTIALWLEDLEQLQEKKMGMGKK